MALGSKATFSYAPTENEIKKYLALKNKKSLNFYKNYQLSDEEKKYATEALIEAEKERPLADRNTAGDASESGLIKFI